MLQQPSDEKECLSEERTNGELVCVNVRRECCNLPPIGWDVWGRRSCPERIVNGAPSSS